MQCVVQVKGERGGRGGGVEVSYKCIFNYYSIHPTTSDQSSMNIGQWQKQLTNCKASGKHMSFTAETEFKYKKIIYDENIEISIFE